MDLLLEKHIEKNTAVKKNMQRLSHWFLVWCQIWHLEKLRFISLFEEERHTVQQWGAVATSITWASLMKTLISTLCYRRQSSADTVCLLRSYTPQCCSRYTVLPRTSTHSRKSAAISACPISHQSLGLKWELLAPLSQRLVRMLCYRYL